MDSRDLELLKYQIRDVLSNDHIYKDNAIDRKIDQSLHSKLPTYLSAYFFDNPECINIKNKLLDNFCIEATHILNNIISDPKHTVIMDNYANTFETRVQAQYARFEEKNNKTISNLQFSSMFTTGLCLANSIALCYVYFVSKK